MLTATATVTVTDEQREQLDRDGFFVTDVLFDEATLEGVRQEFKRFWDKEIAAAVKSGDAHKLHWAKIRPHMAQLDHFSPICHAFCHHPVFADLCRQLLGPDADLSWNQAIVKAPVSEENAGTKHNALGWHQDMYYALNGTFKDDCHYDKLAAPNNGFTCWIAISRTTVDNGTLWVLPGRHKEGLLPHVWSEERNEYQGQFDTSWRIPAVLHPGQMLVFRKYLPHYSGNNVSDEVRMAYQLGYAEPGISLKPNKNFTPMIRNGEIV
jgi:ectoine hydroxylase-related dioxygenase (phytanoyl-CoA dioxygenase family)